MSHLHAVSNACTADPAMLADSMMMTGSLVCLSVCLSLLQADHLSLGSVPACYSRAAVTCSGLRCTRRHHCCPPIELTILLLLLLLLLWTLLLWTLLLCCVALLMLCCSSACPSPPVSTAATTGASQDDSG